MRRRAEFTSSRGIPLDTIMIAKGYGIRIIKGVLRHRDIRTSLRYAHVADKTKRERYEQYLVL